MVERLPTLPVCVAVCPRGNDLAVVAVCAAADSNGLFWRITQHSGAELLPQVSSHMLVSVHLFLEMLHYAVWIVALPLIGRKREILGPENGAFSAACQRFSAVDGGFTGAGACRSCFPLVEFFDRLLRPRATFTSQSLSLTCWLKHRSC